MAVLEIEEHTKGGTWAELQLRGEIDADTVGALRGRLQELQDRGVRRLLLDLEQTSYVNSSALAVLVKFAERFKGEGGGIALAQVSSRVRIPFEMLGLLQFFKFYDTVEAARSAFPAQAR